MQVVPVRIDLIGFQRWLSGKNIQSAGSRADYLFGKLDTDANGFVDVAEYVNRRLLGTGEFLCHAPEDVSTAAVAFPGCPCNAIDSPALGACPVGTYTQAVTGNSNVFAVRVYHVHPTHAV